MDLLDLIKETKDVEKYEDKAISTQQSCELLEAFSQAPSMVAYSNQC